MVCRISEFVDMFLSDCFLDCIMNDPRGTNALGKPVDMLFPLSFELPRSVVRLLFRMTSFRSVPKFV